MRLRTQLALFFAAMSGIILGLSFLAVWGGIQMVDNFSASLADMEKLSQVRNLQNLLARQRSAMDLYLKTRERNELSRISDLSAMVTVRLRELRSSGAREDPLIDVLEQRYKDIRDAVPSRAGSGGDGAFRELIARQKSFSAVVNQAEVQIEAEVRDNQSSIRQFVRQGAQLIVLFIFWEIVMGFLFTFSTFRSLSRSLFVLQRAAAAFGRGELDHRIDLRSKDELGDLARSFNEMADNIKQLEVKTVHMHRMSAVGQLAGGVAHEINNPLTGVLGQAQILLEKIPPEDIRRTHVEKIERAAVRCRRIVRSLLDFSRQKETHFAPLDVNEAVNAALDLCEADLQRGRIRVAKTFDASLSPMTGNASQLQQVFLNILSNAIQAMPEGGDLSLTTRLTSFSLPTSPEGKKVEGVEILFQDTGQGIEAEHLRHVFEPFFTTKEIGKGTGLGLSVSLGIVRNHGGTIVAESAGKGKGTVFRVYLPLSAPPLMAPPAPQLTDSPAPGLPARF